MSKAAPVKKTARAKKTTTPAKLVAPTQAVALPPAGWYADPVTGDTRHWDGEGWTDQTPPPAPAATSTPEMAEALAADSAKATTAAAGGTRVITKWGRDFEVQMPGPGQLVMLQIIGGRLENPNLPKDRQVKELTKMFSVMGSILVGEDALDWLEEAVIRGTDKPGGVSVVEALDMAGDALRAFGQAKPTTGPVRKATRSRR